MPYAIYNARTMSSLEDATDYIKKHLDAPSNDDQRNLTRTDKLNEYDIYKELRFFKQGVYSRENPAIIEYETTADPNIIQVKSIRFISEDNRREGHVLSQQEFDRIQKARFNPPLEIQTDWKNFISAVNPMASTAEVELNFGDELRNFKTSVSTNSQQVSNLSVNRQQQIARAIAAEIEKKYEDIKASKGNMSLRRNDETQFVDSLKKLVSTSNDLSLLLEVQAKINKYKAKHPTDDIAGAIHYCLTSTEVKETHVRGLVAGVGKSIVSKAGSLFSGSKSQPSGTTHDQSHPRPPSPGRRGGGGTT